METVRIDVLQVDLPYAGGAYRFVTSLTVTHHKDLLEVPLGQFKAFSEPRLTGTTAYRTTKKIRGKTRTVVVTRSEKLLCGQLAGIKAALMLSSLLQRKAAQTGIRLTIPALYEQLSDI